MNLICESKSPQFSNFFKNEYKIQTKKMKQDILLIQNLPKKKKQVQYQTTVNLLRRNWHRKYFPSFWWSGLSSKFHISFFLFILIYSLKTGFKKMKWKNHLVPNDGFSFLSPSCPVEILIKILRSLSCAHRFLSFS